ncbi:hypothetical protein ID852_14205 [Xenorhabdus sp. 42]|uniref:hypothetical protein n=1 Tax=Xenorhabdus szentirmaii TaxID=290112 RepID=UPI0019C246D6|nr:hypothetical protein [Xenorhabdus sp. 42]MBD2821820.1 hypothetical protein [Xenorhabdus sp. 42]
MIWNKTFIEIIRRTVGAGKNSYLMQSVALITGTSCTAFMVMALDQYGQRAGTFAPENWTMPKDFYSALERVGTPHAEIVESV